MFFSGDLYYRIYGVCIGILACRGLSLRRFDKCLNHFPATYLTTPRISGKPHGLSFPRRLESPTSQTIQLPELELTLIPAIGREHSQEINNLSVPALISQALRPSRKRMPASETSELNPEDVTARLEDLEVEIGHSFSSQHPRNRRAPDLRIAGFSRSCRE
ncbi:hypothetical protein Tco_1499958 [Tanacetum coccineum]